MKYYTAALLIVSALLADKSSAFSVGSSMTSAFGGSVLITGKDYVASHGATIEMKKGKDNVPAAMRTQYKRQREMSDMREQMMDSQKPGADGFPVFNLYVRSERANVSLRDPFLRKPFFVILVNCFSYFELASITDVVPMWIIQGR